MSDLGSVSGGEHKTMGGAGAKKSGTGRRGSAAPRGESAPPGRGHHARHPVPVGDTDDDRSRSPPKPSRDELIFAKVPVDEVAYPEAAPTRTPAAAQSADENEVLKAKVAALDVDMSKAMKFITSLHSNVRNHALVLDQLKARERIQKDIHARHSENMLSIRGEVVHAKKASTRTTPSSSTSWRATTRSSSTSWRTTT